MQRLFNAAKWDVDGVRDDIRGYLMEHLSETDGVPVSDDTEDSGTRLRSGQLT
ncbi:hypothetical protein ACIHFD_47515 [Nonomuraea sp. NPDC051941]|uniref:hypothetical protein n=1 Tax=Nonomuraea sp. NPDC051941 TaxID=3364373 RepID=UPI0037CB7BDF